MSKPARVHVSTPRFVLAESTTDDDIATLVASVYFPSLSLKARGMLVTLALHKSARYLNQDGLTELHQHGEGVTRTAINELIEAGLLQRRDVREPSGRMLHNHYVLVPEGATVDV